MFTQVTQAVEKPHLSQPAAFSLRAASNTSGQVFGGALRPILASAPLSYHITVDEELKGNESISPFESSNSP